MDLNKVKSITISMLCIITLITVKCYGKEEHNNETADKYESVTYGNHNYTLTVPNHIRTASDQSLCQKTIFWLRNILVIGICVFGITGNSLAFIILQLKGNNSTMNVMLKLLAVVDNFYLISYVALHVVQETGYVGHNENIPRNISVISRIAQLLSVWLLVLIGAIRYIAVCKPLYVKTLCTIRRVGIVVVIFLICDVAIHIPQFNMSKYKYPWNDYHFKIIYFGIFYNILLYFLIPFGCLSYMNYHLVKTLRRIHRPIGETIQRSHRHEMQDVTRVVIAIITTFLVTYSLWVFTGILQIIRTVNFKIFYKFVLNNSCMYNIFMKVVTVSLTLVNSSINFFIYLLLRGSFRSMLKQAFAGKGSSRRSRISSDNSLHTIVGTHSVKSN